MIEIIRARLGCYEKARVDTLSTTDWIKKQLGGIHESDLEIVQVSKNQWLAYRISGYAEHLPLNTKATSLLQRAYKSAPSIHGDCVVFDKEAILEKV